MKLNSAARTHLAKAVLSPLGFTIGGFFSAHAFKVGSFLLLSYAAIIFCGFQFLAIFVLSVEDDQVEAKDKKGTKNIKKLM